MKIIKLAPVYIILALGFSITAFAQNNNAAKPAKKGFAVLELFTSEGCSSCPPADELMGKIQEEYKDNDVYVLSYHVDYWIIRDGKMFLQALIIQKGNINTENGLVYSLSIRLS